MTIISFSKKYIFIENHETGSEIIRKHLNKYDSEQATHNYIYLESVGPGRNYISVKNYLDLRQININDFYIFGFIRNPITRIASCYQHEYAKKMSNVKDLNLNSKDFNLYIKKDLNLYFNGLDTVFYNHERKIPPNVHIFEIEKIKQEWSQIRTKLGLKNTLVPHLNLTSEDTYYLEPSTAIAIREKYPFDWDFYFNR